MSRTPRPPLHRRRLLIAGSSAAVAILAAAGLTGGTASAAGAPCTAASGVTVIVDFTHWGGAIERGCAAGQPASGLDALHRAGFSTAGTTQYGDAFVCRISDLPSPSEQSCTSTPPGNAFWASYHAQPGDGSWTYSSLGATSTHPAPGSIEAWAFGARALPGISPAQAIAPPVTVPPTAPPTTARPSPPPTAAGGHGSTGSATVNPGTGSPSGANSAASLGAVTAGGVTRPASGSSRAVATTVTTATTVPGATRPTLAAAAGTKHPAVTTTTRGGAAVVEHVASGTTKDGGGGSGSPLPLVLTVAGVAAVAGTTVAVRRSRQRRTA